ncbi:hypothetical protein [Cupriavidus pampae]|uniref:DUF4142 domain-containing protein n=1 Tax=Cupriavidus pampae TaxID=659251 RepID=A0ABM8XIT8_9BURK|nr:hypothetical protein [Cupriavidus pampae]CAG9180107.1 hypothetical protein LMG32289_04506 [Cupriavidus pampae]
MKKTSVALAVLVGSTLFAAAPAAMAFGLGNITSAIPGVGGGSAAAVSAGDIDAFIQTANDANLMISTSSSHIFKALASKEDIAALEARLATANAIANTAEKEAELNKIKSDEATIVQKVLASKEGEDKLSTMNKAQMASFGNAAFTFMLGVLKDKQLAEGSTALVSGVSSNPMLIPRLGALKDVASSVSSQLSNTAKIGEGLVKLAKAGKITALPTSASEKPKKVDEI